MRGLILAFAVVVTALVVPVAQAKPVSSYYTSQAYRALMLRSEGMNQWYRQQAKAAPVGTSSSSGFDWTTFSVGVSAFAATMIVAGGVVIVRRNRPRRFAV